MATIYLLGGSFCLVGAVAPPSPATPRLLHAVLAGVGLVGAPLQWWLSGAAGRRAHRPLLHASLAVNVVLTWLLMVSAATPAGHVLIGYNFVYLAMVAAYFLPRREARAHTGLVVVAVLSASQASGLEARALVGPIVAISVVTVSEVLGRLATRLRSGATTDPLTGVLNRGAFLDVAHDLLAASGRRGQPISLVIADLDDFKRINDERGHAAGDEVLMSVAETWRGCLRSADVLARVGGDEFVVLLPGAAQEQAREVVRRMRAATEVPWSSGIATTEAGGDLRSLYEEADNQLYAQKRQREPRRDAGLPRQRAATASDAARRLV
ncbi:MAG TPA: GGDEF domain-containing protein [Actinomycetales bacterium]|nr:GGDEF domain-containing protein [Actinomycetales bacterium]